MAIGSMFLALMLALSLLFTLPAAVLFNSATSVQLVESVAVPVTEPLEAMETLNVLTVEMGKEFTVTLRENPSTGYSWTYAIDPEEGLVYISDEAVLSSVPSGLAGAPNDRVWTFKAEARGTYRITFVYDRGFEASQNPKTEIYEITVQ